MKKAFSISAIALVILAVGLMSYYYFIYNGTDPETGEKVSFREFLPFGSGSEREPGETEGGPGEGGLGETESASNGNITRPVAALPAFHKIGDGPVAGYASFSATATAPIRYVDRATGHIHEYDLMTGTDEKISNTTVPKIRQIAWLSGARSLVMRYLGEEGEIESFYGNLVTSTTTGTSMEVKGGFLPKNLDAVVGIPGSSRIFSIVSSADGANGFVSDLDGGNRTLVFKSQVSEWRVEALNSDTVALTTKPASYAEGYAYLLNLKSGKLAALVGGKNGLMAKASPNGEHVIYSEVAGTGIVLKYRNLKTGTTKDLGISTIADKCAWNKTGSAAYCAGPVKNLGPDFVDLWLQGVASESDNLWKIDAAAGGSISLVLSGQNEKSAFDAKDVSLDASGKHLLFINKRDLGLWTYKLPEQATSSATTSAPRT